jgi:hypothetical protein
MVQVASEVAEVVAPEVAEVVALLPEVVLLVALLPEVVLLVALLPEVEEVVLVHQEAVLVVSEVEEVVVASGVVEVHFNQMLLFRFTSNRRTGMDCTDGSGAQEALCLCCKMSNSSRSACMGQVQ